MHHIDISAGIWRRGLRAVAGLSLLAATSGCANLLQSPAAPIYAGLGHAGVGITVDRGASGHYQVRTSAGGSWEVKGVKRLRWKGQWTALGRTYDVFEAPAGHCTHRHVVLATGKGTGNLSRGLGCTQLLSFTASGRSAALFATEVVPGAADPRAYRVDDRGVHAPQRVSALVDHPAWRPGIAPAPPVYSRAPVPVPQGDVGRRPAAVKERIERPAEIGDVDPEWERPAGRL